MRHYISLFILVTAMTFAPEIHAQKFSGPDKSPHDIAYYRTGRKAPPIVKVIYGRPQKKGRPVAGTLIPFDAVWRTGANEATEITFFKDVIFGDKEVKAGTYSLFSLPGRKEWVIILNSDTDVWGAFDYNEAHDVARTTVPASSDSKSLESFSITFEPGDNGADMYLGWDTVRVKIPIREK
ncbi:DUF2911 domain-containing protein [Sinomicrobium weinanense]|uniref:DUF2911 domain-containing protein n=1 Tax=Sinomicrobium weinanense TaxID=2842200 RepID=A0A926JS14_9FLAO|nr:DUF2911 domain-containing protein [Sinomicrobium weinanense]MBC9796309.1 DUF2911 domain-containing protein [Sinomicrobium weinanense]MBU3123210.1 DUF2911 domain-containing protein [Sinomicrobium weinanense]